MSSYAIRNLAALVVFWLSGFVLVQVSQRADANPLLTEAMLLIACIIGVIVSVRVRAREASFVVGGIFAFVVAELIAHAVWGTKAVQGGATHWTVLLAGGAGVVAGLVLSRVSYGAR